MSIPIHNIYYLLSYAWNKLDEENIVRVDAIACDTLVDLLAKVLANGMTYVLRGGLDRGYLPYCEQTATLRGKIDFVTTLKRTYFRQPSVYCHYDELDYNVLHNRIVKTIIGSLLQYRQLDRNVHSDLLGIYRQLSHIRDIALTKRHFGLVQLHSNNYFYDFLLDVCEVIYDNLLMSEHDGTWTFKDFVRDERKMATLFEAFVRNFYKREQRTFVVSRETLTWDARRLGDTPNGFLPTMQTDISLTSIAADRKIIIDTKYYKEALKSNYDKDRIISANLYQIYAYLEHVPPLETGTPCEGMLLYPSVDTSLNLSYDIKGYPISIRTINLHQPWQQIHRELLDIIGLAEIEAKQA